MDLINSYCSADLLFIATAYTEGTLIKKKKQIFHAPPVPPPLSLSALSVFSPAVSAWSSPSLKP